MSLNQMGRQAVLELLRENILEVTFTKKSGEQRIMTCTLDPDVLRAHIDDKYSSDLKESQTDRSNCVVWDLKAQAWRSFLWDNITDFEITERTQ